MGAFLGERTCFSHVRWPEVIGNKAQAKSSVSRQIRSQVVSSYPALEPVLDQMWGKKTVVELIKCRTTPPTTLVAIEGQILFFQVRDGPFLPHLKLVHKYPDVMVAVTADKGAIRHVLQGSDVMDVGMTSSGGQLPPDEPPLTVGHPVQVRAEGKEHAMAVGVLLKTPADIRKTNEGKGVATLHFLGDGLWEAWTEPKKAEKEK